MKKQNNNKQQQQQPNPVGPNRSSLSINALYA